MGPGFISLAIKLKLILALLIGQANRNMASRKPNWLLHVSLYLILPAFLFIVAIASDVNSSASATPLTVNSPLRIPEGKY